MVEQRPITRCWRAEKDDKRMRGRAKVTDESILKFEKDRSENQTFMTSNTMSKADDRVKKVANSDARGGYDAVGGDEKQGEKTQKTLR
jgi:hypothetical protein